MRSVVYYASRSGNTRRVAEAIAEGLRHAGEAEVLSVGGGPAGISDGIDLMVVGGPTEAHGVTQPMVEFLDRMPTLRGDTGRGGVRHASPLAALALRFGGRRHRASAAGSWRPSRRCAGELRRQHEARD